MKIFQLWNKRKVKEKTVLECEVLRLTSENIRFYDPVGHALSSLDGITRADVDYARGEILAEFDPNTVSLGEIVHAINSMGYRITKSENTPNFR